MRRWTSMVMTLGGILLMPLQQAASQDSFGNDLRDIRIGVAVAKLPSTGYIEFSCPSDPNAKPAGWSDWRDCPVDADGLRGLRFGLDPTTSRDGTIVAGHPAVLTALIDDAGTVAGLKIDTDPKARLYLRKKAFLFAEQVKARYGSDGWTCTQAQPDAGEQPVGGVYIKEKCTKTMQGRALTIERNLFRRTGQDEKSFIDETRFTVLRAHLQSG